VPPAVASEEIVTQSATRTGYVPAPIPDAAQHAIQVG
jgi:hypothetical protein